MISAVVAQIEGAQKTGAPQTRKKKPASEKPRQTTALAAHHPPPSQSAGGQMSPQERFSAQSMQSIRRIRQSLREYQTAHKPHQLQKLQQTIGRIDWGYEPEQDAQKSMREIQHFLDDPQNRPLIKRYLENHPNLFSDSVRHSLGK